jgi:NAD(P)H-hydrate epimerase
MRILNTKQIKELDAYTIRQEGIASIELMERAARAFADWFTLRIEPTKRIGIVCGTGNNGGDGLAIARMLIEWRYPVKVWVIKGGVPESEDFKINLKNLPQRVAFTEIKSESEKFSFEDCDILIDALFGSGLSRPAEGLYAKAINEINQSPGVRIAVDIPSGLMADSNSSGVIVEAHYTLSFQLPKLAFFLPQSYAYTGEWILVDIGLDKKFIKDAKSPYQYMLLKDVRKIMKPRRKYDHKGNFGHALLIAGSFGKVGAAVLSSRAALRSGLGLLTVHIPRCGYEIMQTTVPEAMSQVDKDHEMFSGINETSHYNTLGIGPGLGQDEKTVQALKATLETFKKPVVLDADALNILASNRDLLKLIPPKSILTPHPREFERLVGKWRDDFERLKKLKELAAALKAVIVLKGAHTSIATDDGLIFFNSTGNPGMATGGTGDVLTGILTGLLAQGYNPGEAAILGVFLHGLAGDLAAAECGANSLVASDLIDFLPNAFLKVTPK